MECVKISADYKWNPFRSTPLKSLPALLTPKFVSRIWQILSFQRSARIMTERRKLSHIATYHDLSTAGGARTKLA